jgi:capsule biosynthesis phosphatase
MRTWVFDLDGTICSQERFESYHLALPIEKVIEKMHVFHVMGDRIIIHTARGMNTFGGLDKIPQSFKDMTEKWLKDNDVPYDQLVFGKPAGDVYVDDKGMNVNDFT